MSAILLVGMLILSFSTQPVRSSSPEVFFSDDFNDGAADGWTEHLGTWSVINGEYFTSLGIVENGISTVDNLTITDCAIQTELRFRDTEVGFRAGIIFRYHDSGHYYSFELSNEYDKVELFYYTPEKSDYGYGCMGSINYYIQSNVNYTLKVEILGNTFRGFINGEMLISGMDGNLTEGKVGLRGRRADVFFDDFKVLSAVNVEQTEQIQTEGGQQIGQIQTEGQISVLSHNGYYIPLTGWYVVVGEIENVGNTYANFINVTVRFYDSNDRLLDTLSSPIPIHILKPGEKSPFKVFLEDSVKAKEVDHYEIDLEFTKFDWEVQTPDLQIVTSKYFYEKGEWWIGQGDVLVEGEIKNIGVTLAENVLVYATFYDKNGRVVDAQIGGRVGGLDLKPNETASFRIELGMPNERIDLIADYALTAEIYIESPSLFWKNMTYGTKWYDFCIYTGKEFYKKDDNVTIAADLESSEPVLGLEVRFWILSPSSIRIFNCSKHTDTHGRANVTFTISGEEGNYTVMSEILVQYSKIIKNTASFVLDLTPPEAVFTYSPLNPKKGETIIFNASASHDGLGTIAKYEWDFGDGTNSTGETVTHSYQEPGNYTITLKVTDAAGNWAIGTVLIIVMTRFPWWILGVVLATGIVVSIAVYLGKIRKVSVTPDKAEVHGEKRVLEQKRETLTPTIWAMRLPRIVKSIKNQIRSLEDELADVRITYGENSTEARVLETRKETLRVEFDRLLQPPPPPSATESDCYKKLLDLYTPLHGSAAHSALEPKILSYIKQGLNREEAILRLAKEEKVEISKT